MWEPRSLDVRPNEHTFAAAIRRLTKMSRAELEATVPAFVGKVARWPASARRLHLEHARFVPIAGELSVYCADVEAVAGLLSRSKLENVRRVELFIPRES